MPETKLSPPDAAGSPSGARTLPQPLRHLMEVLFGRSLSDVKVHEDHRATLLGAKSYAQGSDIIFAPGQYDPGSQRGQFLIAHELTHVVQQRQGQTEVVSGMVEVRTPPVSGE